jgi:GcrA cell cycle regulator
MADQASGSGVALSWTSERVDLLRRLWLEGLSASRIAAELAGGITRNAVIGKVHRLGLSGRLKLADAGDASGERAPKATVVGGAPSRPVAAPAPQRAVAMSIRGNAALAMQERPAPAPRPQYEDNVVPMMEHVTIMELRESMCRWPVGDPSSSEFRYCGGKAPIGEGPYCKHHSRMAYQPAQDRRQRKIA